LDERRGDAGVLTADRDDLEDFPSLGSIRASGARIPTSAVRW
jgi:hypothetical protein